MHTRLRVMSSSYHPTELPFLTSGMLGLCSARQLTRWRAGTRPASVSLIVADASVGCRATAGMQKLTATTSIWRPGKREENVMVREIVHCDVPNVRHALPCRAQVTATGVTSTACSAANASWKPTICDGA
jgi:hypothetical protein